MRKLYAWLPWKRGCKGGLQVIFSVLEIISRKANAGKVLFRVLEDMQATVNSG